LSVILTLRRMAVRTAPASTDRGYGAVCREQRSLSTSTRC